MAGVVRGRVFSELELDRGDLGERADEDEGAGSVGGWSAVGALEGRMLGEPMRTYELWSG